MDSKDEPPPDNPAGHDKPNRVFFRLLVTWPNGTSEGFEVSQRPVSIGRSDDCSIQIREAKVSRRHCVVFVRAGRLHLQDQDSANGTFVNDSQVTQAQLRPGDTIRVGSVPITVEVASAGGLYGVSLRRASKSAVRDRPDDDTLSGSFGEATLMVLDRMCSVYGRATDERRAARAILELLAEIVPVERAFLLLLAPTSGSRELLTVASLSRSGEAEGSGPISVAIDQVLALRKPLASTDVQADSALMLAFGDELQGVGVILCAPLEHEGELLGVVYCDAPDALKDVRLETLSLFKLIVSHCGAVITRARYVEQVTARSSRLVAEHEKYRDHVHKLERMVNQSTSSVEDQGLELLMCHSELETLKESRQSMTQGLIQDVRVTVDAALGHLDLLSAALHGQTETARSVARTRHLAQRLVALAENMLAIVQIEDGAFGLSTEPVEVTRLLGVALDRNSPTAISLGVRLKLGAIPTEVLAIADLGVVSRVLDVLVGNALAVADQGSTVVLSARQEGSTVSLSVVVAAKGKQSSGSWPVLKQKKRPAGVSSGSWQALRGFHRSSPAPEPLGVGMLFCRLAAEAHGGSVAYASGHGMNQWALDLPAKHDSDNEDTVTH